MNNVRKEVDKFENILKQTSLYLQVNHIQGDDYIKETVDEMVDALEDDLNTSLALTRILGQVKVLNQLMRTREKDNDEILIGYNTLIEMLDVIGFEHNVNVLSEEDITLYNDWMLEKSIKNFEKADVIRKELIEKGII